MSVSTHVVSIPLLRLQLTIRNRKDFLAGLLFAGAGLFFLVVAHGYTLGTASRMGPGFFPFWVGAILALFGLVIAAQSLSARAEIKALPSWHWRGLGWVLGSAAAFGALLESAGLVCSLGVLVALASRASEDFSWRAAAGTAAAIVGISLVVFVWLLKVEIPTWPAILFG